MELTEFRFEEEIPMACHVPGCLGNYDFDKICSMARRRFLEGKDTVSLLKQARNQRERAEIVLVSLLDLDEVGVRELQLGCPYADQCKVIDCRQRVKAMIERDMAPAYEVT